MRRIGERPCRTEGDPSGGPSGDGCVGHVIGHRTPGIRDEFGKVDPGIVQKSPPEEKPVPEPRSRGKIVTVSLETMQAVDVPPALGIREEQNPA